MTYNFDPELWFQIREQALLRRLEAGEMSRAEYETRLEALTEEYQEMVRRSDVRHEYY